MVASDIQLYDKTAIFATKEDFVKEIAAMRIEIREMEN
jgi:hypothetical protein